MSELHIDMANGERLIFDVVGGGWLEGKIGETLLHVEDPEPDFTGKKPSRVYRPCRELSLAEWIEIDFKLDDYFQNIVEYPDAVFGFGEVVNKTETTVEIYNEKTKKGVVLIFKGNIIVESNLVESKK